MVNTENTAAVNDQELTAKPNHSKDSPKKLAPETYSNKPPEYNAYHVLILQYFI